MVTQSRDENKLLIYGQTILSLKETERNRQEVTFSSLRIENYSSMKEIELFKIRNTRLVQ